MSSHLILRRYSRRASLQFKDKPSSFKANRRTGRTDIAWNGFAELRESDSGLHISHDSGTWIESLYITAQVVGMTVSTFWAVTVSLRRFAVFAVVLGALAACLIPLSENLAWLFAMRVAEGLSAGLTIPLLLMIALRVVPLPFRLYGLSAYALTATFGLNAATSLAGIWTDLVDWRFAFWQALPLYSLAGTMLWYGVG